MGTRGFVGYQLNGKVRGIYNQYDSYPNGLGRDVVESISKNFNASNLEQVKDNCRKLNWSSEGDSEDSIFGFERNSVECLIEIMAAVNSADGLISTSNVVREFFASGLALPDCTDFTKDGLMCEWTYLINLDDNQLEVYQHGFDDHYQTIEFNPGAVMQLQLKGA